MTANRKITADLQYQFQIYALACALHRLTQSDTSRALARTTHAAWAADYLNPSTGEVRHAA